MSQADDVFIRRFIILLVILAIYGVGAAFLGVWVESAARHEASQKEEAVLERIAPVGQLRTQ